MLGHNDTRDQPLGQSGVASIVVAVLYFLGAAAIVANYRHTGFNYYRVLISSTLRALPSSRPCLRFPVAHAGVGSSSCLEPVSGTALSASCAELVGR